MSEIRANTIANAAGTGPVSLTSQIVPKTTVNINSGTSIRSSFNVSSITDNGVGDYTTNLSSAYSNQAQFAATGGGNATHGESIINLSSHRTINRSTSTGAAVDTNVLTMISCGDLA